MFIYFIRSCDSVGLTKIGYSATPEKRLEALQTGSAHRLELVGKCEVESIKRAKELEKLAHYVFRYCRRGGEWFTNNQPLRDFVARSLVLGIEPALAMAYKATKKKITKYNINMKLRGTP